MKVKLYQVDAFTNIPFKGNPAAVCYTESELSVEKMLAIAAEMNLSETAFIVLKCRNMSNNGEENVFSIRWFSPRHEMPLCGHATLAASKVIFNELRMQSNNIVYESKSGRLEAVKEKNKIILDFPLDKYNNYQCTQELLEALGVVEYEDIIIGVNTRKLIIRLKSEQDIIMLSPNFSKLSSMEVDFKGVGLTAKGEKDYDIVTRYFNPWAGVNEDPVTGSVHTVLASYWSNLLGKSNIIAYQASQRGGFIYIETNGEDRVSLAGEAVVVFKGELFI